MLTYKCNSSSILNALKIIFILFLLAYTIACNNNEIKAEGNISKIEIYKYNKAVQCGFKGIPLEKMKQELVNAGIQVFSQRKGRDNMMRISLCGKDTGLINIYTIPANSINKALDLGFKNLPVDWN